MMRPILCGAALLFAAGVASAQDPLSHAKGVAHKAANAENRHIANEQAPEGAPKAAPNTAQSKSATVQPRVGAPSAKLSVPKADTSPPPTMIMREVFTYDPNGRRDPFVSLLNTSELRPAITDLRLTGILYDPSGRNSMATLRDIGTNAMYRVTLGTTLGRMQVSAIRLRSVIFTVDEFGTTRQDSLVLGDSSKVRVR